ncbi:MAG: carotenoid oxygenase family protein [Rhizobacter sp.]|nr:carotenoid oxygenase family protein [Rhizobacter sp.]
MANAIESAIRSTITKGIVLLADFNRMRLAWDKTPHPYLTGIHRPMTEEKTVTELAVTGQIPPALDGRYVRIGPNPAKPSAAGHHWFVGDGMVHGIALKEGSALWYRNRWIRSDSVSAVLGKPAAPGPRHGMSDTVNTNVVAIGGRTWALVEAGAYPVELDATFDSQRRNPFDGTLAGSFTAHPHLDFETGEHHAIAYESTERNCVRHVVVSPHGKVVRETPIAVEHGPSIHDCAFTSRYVIVLDLPVTFSMRTLIAGHRFPYKWNRRHRARVGLLPRAGDASQMIWCALDPAYVFHVANAFDAPNGTVVMDVIAYSSMFDKDLRGPDARGALERWTIDPLAKSVVRTVVDQDPQEFPRVDERRFGRPCRYIYTSASPTAGLMGHPGTRLFKHDMQTGGRHVHEFGEGVYPGEFVFVPAAPDAAEDEGWLIGFVVHEDREQTDLVILDARAIDGPPVGVVHLTHRVPPGFHGNWLPN